MKYHQYFNGNFTLTELSLVSYFLGIRTDIYSKRLQWTNHVNLKNILGTSISPKISEFLIEFSKK